MKKVIALLLVLMVVMVLCAGSAFAADGTDAASDFGFAPVMAITVICYLMAAALKATPMDNKWLPVICGVSGGALGIVAWRVMLEYPAKDPLTAIAIGIVSGLAATGVNQIGKQLGKTE